MSDSAVIARQALAWGDVDLALATVVSTWGSAPRPVGSHLLVRTDGHFAGSISGGCVEADVLTACAAAIADRRFQLLTFGVEDDAAWQAGLPCGGTIQVLVQPVGSDGFPPQLFQPARLASRGW